MGNSRSKSSDCKRNSTILVDEEIEHLLKVTSYNRNEIRDWHYGFIVSLQLFDDTAATFVTYMFYTLLLKKKPCIQSERLPNR
jgi:hypothetical protein